ncbi:hypothetical protein LUZ60_015796 [Juncus effusus]|nr:hypothetical protein LUZ60_015796 [Juncus effusus]
MKKKPTLSASTRSVPVPGKWALIRPFFLILCFHCLSVYLFTRGFLLTRTELSSHSHSSDLSLSPCSSVPHVDSKSNSSGEEPRRGGWTRPVVDRVVIVIVDALRFDFVAPSTFFKEKKPWMDRLPILQNLASSEPHSARIFKAIADPPTTSLQRLKALTTGGLPTFIDVGNSFGAPAIKEDNWIHQMAKNGRRVVMMGDDTWVDLFPDQFNESYPYPSFNVKDLDTVDNGVVEHLIPSLHKDNWDVLIAHFLGVDHAGHIYGVNSPPMVQKLQQINTILQNVVDVIKSLKHHEKTMLVVMGDHAQTLNGDHGGGTSEEVETSLFAWSPKHSPSVVSSVFDQSMCDQDLDGNKMCISTIQQLDFAVTISALLGVPFPFGSIGRVNAELYALSPGSWDPQNEISYCENNMSDLDLWEQNYAYVLCINSWQVKRYIDQYSSTSVMGFPTEGLHKLTNIYNEAQNKWQNSKKSPCNSKTSSTIDSFSDFLLSFATLARSAWTEFDLRFMGLGLGIMVISIIFHVFALSKLQKFCQKSIDRVGFCIAFALVMIRAVSFLSNSYILAEGRVANFLLATTAIISTRSSLANGKFKKHDVIFLILNVVVRFGIETGVSKQAVVNPFMKYDSDSELFLGFAQEKFFGIFFSEISPIIFLLILAFLSYKYSFHTNNTIYVKYLVSVGTLLSYLLIAIYWVSERNLVPRFVYGIGFGLLVLNFVYRILVPIERGNEARSLCNFTLVMLFAWSPTILILLGKQGPFVAFISVILGWCIIQSRNKDFSIDAISVTQWSLLSICLFYQTGHWCTFDGLRYGAAFIGFDEFKIFRQAILLAIDTFGVSHVIPVLALPLLVALPFNISKKDKGKTVIFLNLTQVFLLYGLITSVATTFTILCVTIQRRHLMVWGLFAPKYVFDVIGLLLTDVLICTAGLYYY